MNEGFTIAWWHIVVAVILIVGISVGLACMMVEGYDRARRWWLRKHIPNRWKYPEDND